MYIVVYRPHNLLNCDTRYIGPFATWHEADDALYALPACGVYAPDGKLNNPGVKYTQELEQPTAAPRYAKLYAAALQMGARPGAYDVPLTAFNVACAPHTPEALIAAETACAALSEEDLHELAQGGEERIGGPDDADALATAAAVLDAVYKAVFN